MKLRKLMIILILTIFLFSIASVTAANTTDVMTSNDDSTQKNEIISKENEEIIKDGTTGTFAELKSDIEKTEAGSTLKLDKNHTCEDGFYTGGITISKQITIDGRGHTIDAQGKASIFYVQANNVILKNIIFKNGKITRQGGAIYSTADEGSVSNCTFIGNSAHQGGAIYHYGGYCTVSGCIFIGNSADDGGAILSNGEDNTVFGCTFINNTAKNAGDAICTINYLLGDYCWFGNTAENYDASLPIDGDFNCVHRLFLNATVSPDTLSVFNTSNIIFKLYLYNTTSGNTSEYDNSLFKNLNLNINAVNGNINITNIYPEDTVQYTATKGGIGSVTASISTTSFTVYLNNLKIDSNMLVESQEMEYGECIIRLKYNVNATGKVNITLKGKKSNLTFTDLDLNNTISLGIIAVGEYNVTVIYSGDDSFFNGTANGTLIVNMAKTQITADAIITTYNIDKDLVITLKDSNGNPVTNATVTVDLNGAKTYTTDKNGQVKVSTAGLVPKIYTAKISFAGDNNYNGSSMDVGVTVNKATPILKAKKKTYKAKSKTKKFTITLKDNTGKPIKNAKVRLMVKKITKSNKKGRSDKESKADKKKNFAVTNNKGKATFKVLRNKKGKYNAKVKFYSNEYYNKLTKTVKIVIK